MTICIVQFIIICLLLWPHISKLIKSISASGSNKVDANPDKHRISAMIATDLYNKVIAAAQERKCSISAYITSAIKRRLSQDEIRSYTTGEISYDEFLLKYRNKS